VTRSKPGAHHGTRAAIAGWYHAAMSRAKLGRCLLLGLFVTASCRATLHVRPDELAAGTVGRLYEALITVSNNRTPLGGAELTAGTLPPGIAIGRVVNDDTIPLRGTPAQAGDFAFELTLWCFGTNFPGQTTVKRYVVRVLHAP
jgi:hypothetical protein